MSIHHSAPLDIRVPEFSLEDYTYHLPDSRIASQPLPQRDRSRLLVCRTDTAEVEHRTFRDLTALLPQDALLLVNDTRVVRARIEMYKPTGGRVEIFLLEPDGENIDPSRALAAQETSAWKVLVGGARKLASGGEINARFSMEGNEGILHAVIERAGTEFRARFHWQPSRLSFAEVLERVGNTPLPPYIKRPAAESDAEDYQTRYALHEGAVAAPTAGLHFSDEMLGQLAARGIDMERVTLHVGAGTFRPVTAERIEEHEMHRERFAVSEPTFRRILIQARQRHQGPGHPLVIVGTTTLRTVESLYWFGVELLRHRVPEDSTEVRVDQWAPYRETPEEGDVELTEALEAVEQWRAGKGGGEITGSTGLLIMPGYRFRACDALITNFHQPGSTLLLLVGALLGRDLLQRVYREALENGYRFLSYGDSSFLIRSDRIGTGRSR